jgi:hypothetical protein
VNGNVLHNTVDGVHNIKRHEKQLNAEKHDSQERNKEDKDDKIERV